MYESGFSGNYSYAVTKIIAIQIVFPKKPSIFMQRRTVSFVKCLPNDPGNDRWASDPKSRGNIATATDHDRKLLPSAYTDDSDRKKK